MSALEVIRCSCCLVMNNEFKTNARSKYICKFEVYIYIYIWYTNDRKQL